MVISFAILTRRSLNAQSVGGAGICISSFSSSFSSSASVETGTFLIVSGDLEVPIVFVP